MARKLFFMKNLILMTLLVNFLCALDYSLEDVNTTSETFGEHVGPSYFHEQGKVISINYFGL